MFSGVRATSSHQRGVRATSSHQLGEKSAYDQQDYFSNNLGYEFSSQYGALINQNPTKVAEYLREYLINRSSSYYIYK